MTLPSTYPSEDNLRSGSRASLLEAVAMELLRATQPEELVEVLARKVCEATGSSVYFNFLATETPTGPRLRLNAVGGVPAEVRQEVQWYDYGRPVCGVVAQTQRERVVNETSLGDTPDRQRMHALGVDCFACFPLRAGDKLIGTLGFGRKGTPMFGDDELELMRSVIAPTALALQNVCTATALRAAKEAAEAANNAKDFFLAMLSHELRTPLAPVLGTVSLLEKRTDLPSEVREDLEVIRRNIVVETRLIDDLLDMTRIARGRMNLRVERVDLNAVIFSVLDDLRERAEAKQLNVTFERRTEQAVLRADPVRLRQILHNLLDNAVKFTPEGGSVTVRSSLVPATMTLRVEIRDTGIGLSPEDARAIFDPFMQVKPGVHRRPDGLGLGLAIARSLVELHQGTLSVSSPGVTLGCVFRVDLPVGAPEEPRTAAAVTPAREGRSATAPGVGGVPAIGHSGHAEPVTLAEGSAEFGAGRRLLLVENHFDTLQVLARYIRRLGFTVDSADTLAEAIRLSRSRRYDILVSDIGLPDGSGHDLMRALCAGEGLGGLGSLGGSMRQEPPRALAISGFASEDDRRRSRDAGFAEHIVKPVDVSTLENALRRLV